MFPNEHIMVDIETLDTAVTARILSIGACTIHNTPDGPSRHEFYRELYPHQAGRTESQDTLDWWSRQANKPNGTLDLPSALIQFSQWIASLRATPIIWCKGLDFDVAILNHAFRQCAIQIPWKYNHVRDCRTLEWMFEEKIDKTIKNDNAHNALADAKYQSDVLLSLGFELR